MTVATVKTDWLDADGRGCIELLWERDVIQNCSGVMLDLSVSCLDKNTKLQDTD